MADCQKLFEAIRQKIEVRNKRVSQPEKFLLDCFKYFDQSLTELSDCALFERVVATKLAIGVFSTEEL